jgi:putative methyltransferase
MIKNVYLFQPQNVITVNGQSNYWIPYSAGIVWSYVSQFKEIKENFILDRIFFKRDPLNDVFNRIKDPKVVGFSCYIWNETYCLSIAKKIKERWPESTIVFGGAQSSSKLLKYDFIDSIVLAEGEESFLDILRSILSGEKPEAIYNKRRLSYLDIPSPYLTGVFDQLVVENPTALWATTIETNRGCPYACTFCDWGGTTYSKVKKFDVERISKELSWISKNRITYLFVADANFGIFKQRDVEIARLIRSAADEGMIDAVNIQYAKNNIDHCFEIAKIIGPYNRGITVSVQSMNIPTLESIKRSNLEINDIKFLMEQSAEQNVPTYTEVILGLPLETLESWKDGLSQLLELGQHQSIDFSFTEILENSELNSFDTRQKYKIKTIRAEQYYNIVLDDYIETGEIIISTNTMSTEEMIECYMYAWMIVHMHITGYTQLFAKFLRNIENISYRQYYDQLFEILKSGKNSVSEHFSIMQKSITHYLSTGKLDNSLDTNQRGDNLHFTTHEFFYHNQEICLNLGLEAFKMFSTDYKEIVILQQNFVFSTQQNLPLNLSSGINIKSWKKEKVKYKITNRIRETADFLNNKIKVSDNSSKSIDFWALRRKNLLKNQFSIEL